MNVSNLWSRVLRCAVGPAAALVCCLSPVLSGRAATREIPRMLLPPGSSGKTALNWWNGEKLEGELTGADGEFVVWKSALFTEPLRVRREVIRRVDFSGDLRRSEGSFRVALTDGSHLTGEFAGVDEHTVTIQSPLCGKVVLGREHVVCIERINGPGVVAAGPVALLSGTGGARQGGVSGIPLFLAAAGRVATPAFNLASHRMLQLPDKCLVEVVLRSDSVPDFALKLADDREVVSVETWDDELVLVHGDRFASAGKKFGESDRLAHVRVGWDQLSGRCVLYGPDATVWAEITREAKPAPEPVKKPAGQAGGSWLRLLFGGDEPVVVEPSSNSGRAEKGVTLLNKGSGVMVERFCVTEWQGDAPRVHLTDAPSVEFDSEMYDGEPAAKNGETLVIQLRDGTRKEVALASVRAMRWVRKINMERDPALTDLWFSDGNLVRGKLKEVNDSNAVVETSFSAAPLTVSLRNCQTILLPQPAKKAEPGPALDQLDVITAGGITLHGTISPGGGAVPHFLPIGAVAALAPADAKDLSMTRSLPAEGKFERAPALLHVKSGETLPVTLQGVSRDRVEFSWDAATAHEVPTSELHAVQFAAPAAGATGFDGHGWQMIGEPGKSSAARKGEAIVLRPGSGIGHPFLLQGGDISFQMGRDNSGNGLATLRVRLFCQSTDRDSNSINFLIGNFGSEVYCGLERTEGQLENQSQVPARGVTEVRFTFPGDKVEMYINGVRAAQSPLKGKIGRKSGNGIVIETASLWGNQVGPVKLSGLVMKTSPCMAGPPMFSEEAKREALLLPRLRRDDPPRQVLIGRNGDLLRGEIEAMTSTHLAFRAGLENFKVPLDRVAAAVWVKRPDKQAPDKSGAGNENSDQSPANVAEDDRNAEGRVQVAPAAGFALKLAKLVARRRVIEKAPAAVPAEPPAKEAVIVQKSDRTTEGKSPAAGSLQWLDLTNGGRIALKVDSWGKDKVTGQHPLLGQCSIPTASVYSFTPRAPAPGAALAALADWKLNLTADPVLPDDEGGASPLTGKSAATFSLPMLEGADFSLSSAKGKVVVLDFWATWCGPCVKSLPGLIEAMSAYPNDKVVFVAVNQGETREQVKKFLDAREWSMAVAFDADAKVARKYGVDGIPHTVVIDPAGKISFTKTGYEADGARKIAAAVDKALGGTNGLEGEKQEESGADKPQADAPPESLLPPPDLK